MTPETIVYGGNLLLALPIALLAGLISFASPCVLPLLPGYFGYLGSLSTAEKDNRGRLMVATLVFITGFSLIYIAYGALFGALGAWLLQWRGTITLIAGIIIIVMGLAFIGLVPFLNNTVQPTFKKRKGLLGALFLGLTFGLTWVACVGPVLSAIQALSLDSGSPLRGAILGFVYCLGLGLPFLLLAWGFGWATSAVQFMRKHVRLINIAGGVMLVLLGVLMVTGLWNALIDSLQAVIISFVPAL